MIISAVWIASKAYPNCLVPLCWWLRRKTPLFFPLCPDGAVWASQRARYPPTAQSSDLQRTGMAGGWLGDGWGMAAGCIPLRRGWGWLGDGCRLHPTASPDTAGQEGSQSQPRTPCPAASPGLSTPAPPFPPFSPASPDRLSHGSHFTESQNHRIVGVGGALCGSPSPTLLPKQGHPEQAAQDLVQAGLEYLQRRRLHNLPGQPVPFPALHVLPCAVLNNLPSVCAVRPGSRLLCGSFGLPAGFGARLRLSGLWGSRGGRRGLQLSSSPGLTPPTRQNQALAVAAETAAKPLRVGSTGSAWVRWLLPGDPAPTPAPAALRCTGHPARRAPGPAPPVIFQPYTGQALV